MNLKIIDMYLQIPIYLIIFFTYIFFKYYLKYFYEHFFISILLFLIVYSYYSGVKLKFILNFFLKCTVRY